MNNRCLDLCKKAKMQEIEYNEFCSLIDELTKDEDISLNIFYKLYSKILGVNGYYIFKNDNDLFLENKDVIMSSSFIDDKYKNIFKCVYLKIYLSLGDYNKAEEYAKDLLETNNDDYIISKELVDYYIKTRRYDIAGNLINIIKDNMGEEFIQKASDRYNRIIAGDRNEYIPLLDKREKYYEFIESLNIDIVRKDITPKNVDYKIIKPGFTSFVAFDLETTGLDTSSDEIIEIGAIKVVDGKVVETKEFIFQELIKPNKKIPKVVENVTHITNDMVKNKKGIDEIINEFKEFIKDNILIGYNCMSFDKKFLDRLNIIDNDYFDVMFLAKKYQIKLKCMNVKLNEVASKLDITNPEAHRALADAITTAKVYLKLVEMY